MIFRLFLITLALALTAALVNDIGGFPTVAQVATGLAIAVGAVTMGLAILELFS